MCSSDLADEGDVGKQKINQLTRYLAIGLALVQALVMTMGLEAMLDIGVENPTFLTFTYLAIVMTAGSAFLLYLSDQITLRGIGNGTSMIIVAGIVSGMPGMVASLVEEYVSINTADFGSYSTFIIVMLLYIFVIFFVTVMQSSNRKIPIQYSNRPSGAAFQGRND